MKNKFLAISAFLCLTGCEVLLPTIDAYNSAIRNQHPQPYQPDANQQQNQPTYDESNQVKNQSVQNKMPEPEIQKPTATTEIVATSTPPTIPAVQSTTVQDFSLEYCAQEWDKKWFKLLFSSDVEIYTSPIYNKEKIIERISQRGKQRFLQGCLRVLNMSTEGNYVLTLNDFSDLQKIQNIDDLNNYTKLYTSIGESLSSKQLTVLTLFQVMRLLHFQMRLAAITIDNREKWSSDEQCAEVKLDSVFCSYDKEIKSKNDKIISAALKGPNLNSSCRAIHRELNQSPCVIEK